MNIKNSTKIVNGKKFWVMQDGELVKYIAGGSGTDNDDKEYKENESKLKEARSDAAKYRTQLRELQSKTEDFDYNEFKILKEKSEKDKEKDSLERGDYENLLKEKTAALSKQIEDSKNETMSWKNKYESKFINDSISSIAKANNAINIDDIVTIVKSQYEVLTDESGVITFNCDGKISTDENGDPFTVDKIVSSILEVRPYLVKSSGVGAGAMGGTGKQANKEMTSLDRISAGLKSRGIT